MEVIVKAVDGGNKEEDDHRYQALQIKQLPFEVIYEILSRTSLDTLLFQCRWVCKEWRSLCYEDKFKSLQSHRTGTITGYFVQAKMPKRNDSSIFVSAPDHYSPQVGSLPLDFMPKPVIIEAASPLGLLCCSSFSAEDIYARYISATGCESVPPLSFYVCKPVTREWIKIPNPKTRYTTQKMEMVVTQCHPTLHYKIIRFSSRDGRDRECGRWLFCEIFDSREWRWKLYDGARHRQDSDNNYMVRNTSPPGVFVNGTFYWSQEEGPLISFHVDRKRWGQLDLPEENENWNNDFSFRKKLVVYEGKLGVFYHTFDWMELWVMEDYDAKKTWRRVYKIDDIDSPHELVDMYSTDIVSISRQSKMTWYNCKTGSYTGESILQYPYSRSWRIFFPFQSDLVPGKLR